MKNVFGRDEVLKYCLEAYGTEAEYPWLNFPKYAVLRHIGNSKWYCVVMNVARSRLGLDGDGNAEFINVKCDPLLIGSLRKNKGYLPAYHMNKNNWISVMLDGSVPKGEIIGLIDLSYDMTK